MSFSGGSPQASEPMYVEERSTEAGSAGGTRAKKRRSCLGWASAFAALLLLYAVFGLGFWGLLELSEVIRGEDYKLLPSKYYGDYVYKSNPPIPIHLSAYPTGFDVPWNSTLFT